MFLGRAIAEAAVARGHIVTLFNRGNNPDVLPELEQLRGDRDGGLSALAGRSWDLVVDPSGYVPRIVKASAELLADAADHYTFISSVSVYKDFSKAGIDESWPVGTLDDETVEDVGPNYGPLKALSERAASGAFGAARVLNVRAGLIVGPHDVSDRFTYWPARIARGGAVLAAAPPERAIQIIDVRDLAEWIVRMAEGRQSGTFNASGPSMALTMGRLFDECRKVSASDAEPVWVDPGFLIQSGVTPWTELPLWMPETGEYAGLMRVDCSKAYAAGLTFRPLGDTVRATLEWNSTRPTDIPRRAGLDKDREQELLRAWKAQAR